MTVNKVVTTREVVETRVVLDLSTEQAEYLYALLYYTVSAGFEKHTGLDAVRIGLGQVCERKYEISKTGGLIGPDQVIPTLDHL